MEKDNRKRIETLETTSVAEPLCASRRETIDGRVDSMRENFDNQIKSIKTAIYITGSVVAVIIAAADFIARWLGH